MEEREKKFINRYLPQLINNTVCNSTLLAKLQSKKILCEEECQKLQATGKNEGHISQAYQLYGLLLTKTRSYDILLAALLDPDLNQSGAADILATGKDHNFDLTILENDKNDAIVQASKKFLSPLGKLKDLVSNEELPIVVMPTEDITMTTERIQATGIPHEYHLYRSKEILVQNFSKVHSGSVFLVAMHGKKRSALEVVLDSIQDLASGTKQCIVMTTESEETVNGIIKDAFWSDSNKCGVLHDDFKWSQLSRDYQTTLLERLVKFQDEQIVLKNLLALFCKNEEWASLLEFLETKVLVQLMNDEKPEFCRNTLGARPTPPFYIQRKIISRSVAISKDILKASPQDTSFAITGMKRMELVNLQSGAYSVFDQQIRQKDVTQGLTAKFIDIKKPEHFVALCKKIKPNTSVNSLYWLNFNEKRGHLEWMRSYGKAESLSLVQKHIVPMKDEMFNSYSVTEQDFVENLIKEMGERADFKSKPAICISDTPGMGKTTLMAHIGQKLLASQKISGQGPTTGCPRFVQYFSMTELMRELEDKGIREESQLKSEILEILMKRMMGTKVFSRLFKRKGTQCELMLDGFDEVLPHQARLAIKLISTLRHEFSSTDGPTFRVWLTTRPVLLQLVEQTLGVLGYNMLPFDENDQKAFLKTYWIQEARKRGVELNPEKLEMFSNGSLETMKRVSGALSKFEAEMTGVPLQCLLLAQVCEGSVNYECSVEGEGALNVEEEEPDRLAIKNVADLYNRVMDKKLEIFLKRESSSSTHLESHLSKNNKQVMKRIHMKLALELLFPEWLKKFEIVFLHDSNISLEELSIYGFVIDYNQNTPVFVHRTYAEYFVALFAVEMGTCERLTKGFRMTEEVGQFYLDGILATVPESEEMKLTEGDVSLAAFSLPVVTYFIDELLEIKMGREPIPRSLLDSFHSNLKEISSTPFDMTSSKILACITNDRPELAKLLISSLGQDGKQSWLQASAEWHTNMMYAVSLRGNKDGLLMFCDLLENWENLDVSKLSYQLAKNPLLAAALMGKVESVEYLVLAKNFKPEMWATPAQKILHRVVSGSLYQKEQTIENRANIIDFLVDRQKPVEPEESILEHLDFLDRTPLLAENVHIKLRMALIQAGANVQAYNRDGNQILHMLENFVGITPEIYHELIELIENKVLEMVVEDEDERRWIFKNKSGVSREGHIYTPNWFWHDDTPLHLAVGHLEVMDETLDLFDKYGFDWDEKNSDDYTLVHVAVKFGRSIRLIKKLIDGLGADWSIRNLEGRTTFMEAAWSGHSEFLEWICEEYNFDINLMDNNNRTALHYAMRSPAEKRYEAVTILLENGANPNLLNQDGDTPLVQSLYESHVIDVKLLKYLKKMGGNILGNNENDKAEVLKALFSNTTPSMDKEHNLIAVAEYLISEGAELKGPEGRKNLVHLAAGMGWLKGLQLLEKRLGLSEFSSMAATKDNHESTPIYCLIKSEESEKNVGVLKWLINKVGGKIEREACGKGGVTPLHACAEAGWMEGIELLVEHFKVDILSRDYEGNTELHMAYCTDGVRNQVVAYLEEKMGTENLPGWNMKGETPVQYGVRMEEEQRRILDEIWN